MKYFISLLLLVSFTAHATDVLITWTPPTQRENNAALTTAEIGGYEIRYRKTSDAATVPDSVITIPDGKAVAYNLLNINPVAYKITIAAYTTEGLFSTYATVNFNPSSNPKPPSNMKANQKIYDIIAACLAAAPNCRVAVAGEWQ